MLAPLAVKVIDAPEQIVEAAGATEIVGKGFIVTVVFNVFTQPVVVLVPVIV